MASSISGGTTTAGGNGGGGGAGNNDQFSFPILSVTDIIGCLKELGISITAAELKAPEERVMRPVYEQLVDLLTGTSREELRQPQFCGIHLFAYPDIHEESLSELGIIRLLLTLLTRVGIPDATVRDMTTPTPKRTRQILSAIINFAKFREQKIAVYTELTGATDELTETKNTLDADIEAMTEQLAALKAAREAALPTITATQHEVHTLQTEVELLHKTQAVTAGDYKSKKHATHELNDVLSTQRAELAAILGEVDRLKKQVLRDPAALQKELSEKGKRITAGKQQIADSQTKLRHMQNRGIGIARVAEKLTKSTELMGELVNDSAQYKEWRDKLGEARTKLSEKENVVVELQGGEAQLKKSIAAIQDKLFRLQTQFEQKRTAAQLALEQVGADKGALEKSMESEMAKNAECEALIAVKRQQLSDATAVHQQRTSALKSKYTELEGSVRSYHKTLISQLQSVA